MSFFKSMDISGSGMTAQRLRMDIIAQNVANVNTTRGANGQPYRRQETVLQPINQNSFSQYLSDGIEKIEGKGVKVSAIIEDQSPFKLEYDPTNADAGADGYVKLPNIDMANELVDMISASRAYEANVTVINAFKNLATKAMEIGK